MFCDPLQNAVQTILYCVLCWPSGFGGPGGGFGGPGGGFFSLSSSSGLPLRLLPLKPPPGLQKPLPGPPGPPPYSLLGPPYDY